MTRLKLDPSHADFTIDVTSPLRWSLCPTA